jgi:hypothetical protein
MIESVEIGKNSIYIGKRVIYMKAKGLGYYAQLLLTSTGNGTGVSTLTMRASENITLTLGANAHFYTNAGGTEGESHTWLITTGADRTIYLKCTTGTATLTIPKNVITRWTLWQSGDHAASIGGDIAGFTLLTYLSVEGQNTLSGSIAGLILLGTLEILGSNTTSGSITGLTLLTYLGVCGNNTISGDLNPIVSGLDQHCLLSPCAMVDYSAGATWCNVTITINPSTGYGYSSIEIDNMLIDMAASLALVNKVITLRGSSAARTSASDAAVATLVARGCTVVTNP